MEDVRGTETDISKKPLTTKSDGTEAAKTAACMARECQVSPIFTFPI